MSLKVKNMTSFGETVGNENEQIDIDSLWKVQKEDKTIREIVPLTDVFLQYVFKDNKHDETFVVMLNIFLEFLSVEFNEIDFPKLSTNMQLETQWEYLTGKKEGRRQDFVAKDENQSVDYYVEVQRKTNTPTPIEFRSQEYFAFGILQSKNVKNLHQIWLLETGYDRLLKGNIAECYVLKGLKTNQVLPGGSTVSFIDLSKLQNTKGVQGELAKVLLNKLYVPANKKIVEIRNVLLKEMKQFKNDKEAINVLTEYDKAQEEGIAEGEARTLEIQEKAENGLSDIELSKEYGIPLEKIQKITRFVRN